MTETAPANADQAAYWNDAAGRTWADLQDRLDAQLRPLGDAAIDVLSPKPGERILDVGCGCGQTTLALAQAVGPDGSVLGVDISEPMLAVALGRTPDEASGLGGIDYRLADAQTETFGGVFDGVFSRFGVMFFEEPTAAFANLRRALRPDGRLAFVCWRAMVENPMFTAPMQAALRHLPPPPPPQPGAPGPFAFADPDRVRSILADAGFQAIGIEQLDREISPGDFEGALDLAQRIGPLGAMLRDHADRREAVIDDLSSVLRAHERDGQVRFASATWLVTATAP